jgi:CheY-like chemotaxis protein
LIKIIDTGPGIRPESAEAVFAPFERLDAANSDVEGTGIGLALSRSLAEAMGGTLTLDSVPGQGSTFILDLPIVEGPVERFERLDGSGSQTEPAPHASATHKVLYIEDNLSNLRLIERVLTRRPDVTLVSAMQGRLGLELAREHRPMLILLDLHLADIGGEEILSKLLADPATAAIPVVIVSADATPGQVARLLTAGAVAYLTKPIDIDQLLHEIDAATNRRDRLTAGR